MDVREHQSLHEKTLEGMLKNIVSLLPILIMNRLVIVWFPNSYIFYPSIEEKPVRPLFAKGYKKMFLEDARYLAFYMDFFNRRNSYRVLN